MRATRCQARLHGFNTRLMIALTETLEGVGRAAMPAAIVFANTCLFNSKRPNDLDSANKSKKGAGASLRMQPGRYPLPLIKHTNTSLEAGGRLPGVCFTHEARRPHNARSVPRS